MDFDLNAAITFGLIGLLVGGLSLIAVNSALTFLVELKYGKFPNFKKDKRRERGFFAALES